MHSVYASTYNYMEYNILVIIHDEYSIALTEIFFIFFRNTAYIQQVAGREEVEGNVLQWYFVIILIKEDKVSLHQWKIIVKMTQYVGKLLLILILVLQVTLMTWPVRYAVMCAMQNWNATGNFRPL